MLKSVTTIKYTYNKFFPENNKFV